jgi:micrococcal nuclease
MGTRVEVEQDVQARDRYRRLLAYVWFPDGRMLNVEIMREGYAQVLTVPPNVRYARLLRVCQREAREASRGRWASP